MDEQKRIVTGDQIGVVLRRNSAGGLEDCFLVEVDAIEDGIVYTTVIESYTGSSSLEEGEQYEVALEQVHPAPPLGEDRNWTIDVLWEVG